MTIARGLKRKITSSEPDFTNFTFLINPKKSDIFDFKNTVILDCSADDLNKTAKACDLLSQVTSRIELKINFWGDWHLDEKKEFLLEKLEQALNNHNLVDIEIQFIVNMLSIVNENGFIIKKNVPDVLKAMSDYLCLIAKHTSEFLEKIKLSVNFNNVQEQIGMFFGLLYLEIKNESRPLNSFFELLNKSKKLTHLNLAHLNCLDLNYPFTQKNKLINLRINTSHIYGNMNHFTFGLKENSTLVSLTLDFTNLPKSAIGQFWEFNLAYGLNGMISLDSFYIKNDNADIRMLDLRDFFDKVRIHPTLQTLHLDTMRYPVNPDETALSIYNLISQNRTLTSFHYSLERENLDNTKTKVFDKIDLLMKAIQQNTTLQSLVIEGNCSPAMYFDVKTFITICDTISTNKTLAKFVFREYAIYSPYFTQTYPSSGSQQFGNALRRNSSLLDVGISVDDGNGNYINSESILQRNRKLNDYWKTVVTVIAFARANQSSDLKFSVFPLINIIRELVSESGIVHNNFTSIQLSQFTGTKFFKNHSEVKLAPVMPAKAVIPFLSLK